MIVKNESDVILGCLDSVVKHVDYYVINDTGSTDDTREKIKSFFDAHKIKGEIINHDFRTCKCHPGLEYKKHDFFNFAQNRTYALDKCRGKGDYIFFMDADDIIEGDFKLPVKLVADQYYLNVRTETSLYFKPLLIKNEPKLRWKWVGALHECVKGNPRVTHKLLGNYAIVSRRLGARSKDPRKYYKDAEYLELLLRDGEKDPELNERYKYYLAQSWYSANEFRRAIDAYRIVVNETKNMDLQYSCRYMIARCKVLSNAPDQDIVDAFMECCTHHPKRAEPYYQLMAHYSQRGDFQTAYDHGVKAVDLPMPIDTALYIDKSVYDFKLLDELVFCASAIKNFEAAFKFATRLQKEKKYPPEAEDIIKENLEAITAELARLNNQQPRDTIRTDVDEFTIS